LHHSKKRTLWQQLNDGSTPYIIVGYVLCFLYVLAVIIPLYFVFMSAFKQNVEIFSHPLNLPKSFTWDNFVQVEKSTKIGRAMQISLLVTVGAELITLALSFPAAYAIARFKTRMARVVELIFSLGFLIPALAMLVPVFLTIVRTGLLYSPLALILFYPATKLSVSVILLASYLRTVPDELEDCAQMDGASRLHMLLFIFFPLAKPAIVTVLVLNFIDFWNEYLFSLIIMSQANRTIQIAITSLASTRTTRYGAIAAGVLLITIPVIVVFLFFQEQIVKGMYSGAVKG
jgi:multiple sugar transport system permease protein